MSGPPEATEVAAWVADRNAATVGVDWQFTTAHVRIKLIRPYPVLEMTSGTPDTVA
jgi:hypothetical protein